MIELNVAICLSFLHNKMLDINMASMQCWTVLIDNCNGSLIVDVKGVGQVSGKPRLLRIMCRQQNILAARMAARNSVSVLEVVTVGCSLHL